MSSKEEKKNKKKKKKADQEKNTNPVKEVISTILYFACVLLASWLLVTFVGQRTSVNGSSMEPVLHHNDQLILNKISYRFGDPERFDIVVFPFQHAEKTYYVKRVIGLPGETIQIEEDGSILINGEVLHEDYGKEVIQFAGLAQEPITLAEDEYFLMGDNRNNSSDSRDPSVGNVKRDIIMGKVWIRIWPLSGFGVPGK